MLHVDAAAFPPPPGLRAGTTPSAGPKSLAEFPPLAGSAPLRPRRGPRADEIALLRSLAAGPRAVKEGPIGRCAKRGWCRAVVIEAGQGAARTSEVLFDLTELGRALIG